MAKPLPASVRNHLTGLRILLLFTVVCGLVYPLVITGISQVVFSGQANGSLLKNGQGRVVGSSLIGQNFTVVNRSGQSVIPFARYFQSRPSAAGANGYDPTASGGSNLGPNSSVLVSAYTARRRAVALFNGVRRSQVPPDAVTASGSGLDPDISPAYADIQVRRVALVRGLPVGTVRALVKQYTQGRNLGFLGEPRVNVLKLNLALDRTR
jgi:K+-transporting ATPase ATPase C chain